MKALVIFDSVFGNTGQIARAIGGAIAVETRPVDEVTPEMLTGLEVLIVGSPTRGFRPTEGISKFLDSLARTQLKGVSVAAFDTRIDLQTIDSSVFRFIVDKGGYAANTIAKQLKNKGGQEVIPAEGFLVTGEQGPLKDGELVRAAAWAQEAVQTA